MERLKKIAGNKFFRILIFLLVTTYLVIRALKGGDFDVYLFEAKKLLDGFNIYKAPFYKGMPYTYSVFWALILIPFTYLPKFIPEFAWLVMNVFLLYRICILLVAWLQIEKSTDSKIILIFFLAFLLTIRFLLYNFSMIQMTIFLLYACMEGIDLINKKKILTGAGLISLAINIKIVPLVLIPYLLYRNQVKAVVYILFFQILLLFLPGLFIGFEFNQILLSNWWDAVNPLSRGRMLGETFSGTVGLNSLIPVLLMDTEGELNYKRNFTELPEPVVGFILNMVRGILILFTLFFLKFPPFKKSASSIHQLWELSYIFCIIPLLAPQQQKYAFFFVFPAVLFVLYYLFTVKSSDNHFQELSFSDRNSPQKKLDLRNRRGSIIVLLSIFILLTTLTSDGFVGRKLNLVFQHFRTITYGGLILIIALSLCNPQHLLTKELKES